MKMLSSGGLSQNLRKLLGARLCFVRVFEYQNLQIDNTSFSHLQDFLKRTSLLQTRIFRGKPLLASTDHSTSMQATKSCRVSCLLLQTYAI